MIESSGMGKEKLDITVYTWQQSNFQRLRLFSSTGNRVQQPCSNLSKYPEIPGKAQAQKYLDLQLFCKPQKPPANYHIAFARRRSGVRIPSAPLLKERVLQVKHRGTKEAPRCVRGFVLQPYCNPF
jgi:hypothetical protein